MIRGIDEFIEELEYVFPTYGDVISDLKKELEKSSVPQVQFEILKGAYGIALTDRMIINKNILYQYNKNISYVIYVIFHETAHYYQYRKYGEEFALHLYTGDENISELAQELKDIEAVADRFGISKSQYYQRKYNLNKYNAQLYKNISLNALVTSLNGLRIEVKQKNLKTITEINEFIYNKAKNLV